MQVCATSNAGREACSFLSLAFSTVSQTRLYRGRLGLEFLEDYEHVIGWSAEKKGSAALQPELVFIGSGDHGLEVALAQARSRPRVEDVRKLWKARHAGRPSPVLLVVTHDSKAAICGPVGDNPPVINDLGIDQVERLCSAALAEPNRHSAVRFLVAMLDGLHTTELLPGVRNIGMLATHEMRTGVLARADWEASCKRGKKLLPLKGRQLVESLGFGVETLSTTSSVLTINGSKRVVAVFLDEGEGFEDPASRFNGISPVSNALALADRENLPWVVFTRGRQIRLYSARPDIGVGRKGRAETFLELNLALLPEEAAGYLTLLFGPDALADGGTFEEILKASADHAADLGKRLRERVYFDAVPHLAKAVASRMGKASDLAEADLEFAYEQTLVILFRLLFVAYAEDKDLLPYRTNSRYAHNSLKTLSRHLSDLANNSDSIEFDPSATDLWDQVRALWRAVAEGHKDWGVPAYNGGMFSDQPEGNPAGRALAGIKLSNNEIGPALLALLVSQSEENNFGPVDFRSLSVREFGTLYEGLLESRLSIASTDLTLDKRGNYISVTRKSQPVEVHEGEVYFHNRSGTRKSSGSYFTKPFAVDHLLDHALEPALGRHIERLRAFYESGDEAALADAFFDFRCADLAMGSGHFLVAAIDRIEARLSAFLALNPVAPINAELERLRSAALSALGDLADGVEIEHASLLRRQVARRCVYGLDLNLIAVELARLAVWIHTFVPGLPLSFLDHNLVQGNSLTGIATLEEALSVLDPVADTSKGQSLIGQRVQAFLELASSALQRAARITEATRAEVTATREAWEEATAAIEPARRLFDLVVGARVGDFDLPVEVSEEAVVEHDHLAHSEDLVSELQALHLPIAFPEVFLRGQPGFDCIIGNPPWDKIRFEPQQFWVSREPGLNALSVQNREAAINELRALRPVDAQVEERERASRERLQGLVREAFEWQGSGHYDFAKVFVERALKLLNSRGALGYVLPRPALTISGWRALREVALDGTRCTALQARNSGEWLFDGVDGRTTVVLLTSESAPGEESVGIHIWPEVHSEGELRRARLSRAVFLPKSEIQAFTENLAVPWFTSFQDVQVFDKMRSHARLASDQGWIRGRSDSSRWDFSTSGRQGGLAAAKPKPDAWRVLMTRHVLRFGINLAEPYRRFINDLEDLVQLDRGVIESKGKVLLDQTHPRIVYRFPARADDSRTLIAALLPEQGFLFSAGYAHGIVHESQPTSTETLALLAFFNSFSCDWWTRRFADRHVTAGIINGLPLPDWSSAQISEVAELASTLAARRGVTTMVGGTRIPLSESHQNLSDHELIALIETVVSAGFTFTKVDLEVMLNDFEPSAASCPTELRNLILDLAQ